MRGRSKSKFYRAAADSYARPREREGERENERRRERERESERDKTKNKKNAVYSRCSIVYVCLSAMCKTNLIPACA